ncbi:MAG: EAL domain-containing protein [Geminicoccaceae bacterium]
MTDGIDVHALLDLAADPVLVLRRTDDGRPTPTVSAANAAFAALTGIPIERVTGRGLRALRGVFGGNDVLEEVIAAVHAAETVRQRVEVRASGGRTVTVELRAGPLATDGAHYALWLDVDDGPARRPVGGGEPLHRFAGLTRALFYELAVDLDCRLRLEWCDPRLGDLLGRTTEDLVARGGFYDLVVAADAGELNRRNQRLLAGQAGTVTYRVRAPDGEIRLVEDSARPERPLDSGVVTRVVGALSDAGTRQTGGQLGLVENQGALLASCLGAVVCIVDAEGRIRWVAPEPENEVADLIRGQTGNMLASLFPPDAVDLWLDWAEEALAGHKVAAFDVELAVEGRPFRLAVRLTPVGEDVVQAVLWSDDSKTAPPAESPPDEVRALLSALPNAALLVDADLAVAAANPEAASLLGYELGKLHGAGIAQLMPEPGPRTALLEAMSRVRQRRSAETVSSLVWPAAGGPKALVTRLAPVGSNGVLVGLRAPPAESLSRPVVAAAGQAAWFDAVMECIGDGVLAIEADGTIASLSRAAEQILDYTGGSALRRPLAQILAAGATQEGALLGQAMAATDGRLPAQEVQARRRSGEIIPLEVEGRVVDQDGRRLLILAVRDITLRRQTEETIRSLAYHDPLTDLPNRLLFHDRLSQAIERARRNRQLLTVILVDLDRFKVVNDSLGLEKGDHVLRAVADRMTAALRKSDTVARLGGDEFMLLLLGTSGAEAAAKVAQKVLDCLRPPIPVNGHEITIGASLGIALYPHDGENAEELIKHADTALTLAKEQGGNHYQFYQVDMNAAAFERLMLESRLRKALEQGEFLIHYQPLVSLEDGGIIGVEALLRWSHPDLGLVPPGEFIPLAEETGLIVPIGEWVLNTACQQVKRWHRMGFTPLQVAVNLSARQFQQRNLVDMIAAALETSGLPAESLELELTESVIMRDAPETVRRLREITALGIKLAIDDFGTGYSSLGYLKAFPIAALKIDRSFIRDIDRDPNSAAIAEAIIAMAGHLRLVTVAEGVETREQLDRLRGYGCQQLQGFLFSRPLPADDLAALLREGRRLQL